MSSPRKGIPAATTLAAVGQKGKKKGEPAPSLPDPRPTETSSAEAFRSRQRPAGPFWTGAGRATQALILRGTKTRPDILFAIFLASLYWVGILSHLWPPTRPLMAVLTPYFLLATGVAALLLAIPTERRAAYLTWVVLSCLVTFALEALGVATGMVFGAYHYGGVLGSHVLGVPPVIGFNWVMVVLAFIGLLCRLPGGRVWGPLVAAAAATGFDWIMEPVAIGLGYWTWEERDVPLQNYAAWFLIALALSAAYALLGLRSRRDTPAILAGAQLVFFGVLRVALFS